MKPIKKKKVTVSFLLLFVLLSAGCGASVAQQQTSGSQAVPNFDPPYTIHTPLPDSMKGYELYSWMDGDARVFTLITGTDRIKDSSEITSAENIVTVDGWVKVSVQDIEALDVLLSQLPEGETILFMGRPGIGPAPEGGLNISLPPQNTLDSLEEYCTGIGLKLVVVD